MKAIYKKIKAIDRYIKETQEAVECIKTSEYYEVFRPKPIGKRIWLKSN